ncbi:MULTISPECIES: thiamine pyrophosphate-binding protein [Kocuria]|uniref:thiamine pyrophosphate-binding protein n=1 Tax=Kocuria TaxID=57493 RepID=UPI0007EBC5D2|nr:MULTISPECIES: thiamine pyrophosphate-binding protein [unclassified Kocuria]OBA46568.1 acetolactate synthase [Kocuria sp. ICS0012]
MSNENTVTAAPGGFENPAGAASSHPERTTARAVLETLRGYGIDTVFGIPGTHSLEFYRPLRELGIRPITTRHEQGASYGADGWSQVRRLPGVVITTSGPGLLNSLSGAATAYAESRPMILLSPGRPVGHDFRDIGSLHETKNPSAAVNAIVGVSRRVTSAAEAVTMIHDAMRDFAHSRPRPIHIEIPLDILEAPADVPESATAPRPLGEPAPAPEADVAAAVEALAASERPVILAGGGSLAAGEHLLELAELLEAPVITTTNGKGAIPEKHRLSLGADLRLSTAHEFLRSRDALLVIGSKVGEAELWGGDITPQGPVVRVDIMRDQMLCNLTPDVEVPGNSAAVVPQLLAGLRARADAGGPGDVAPSARTAPGLREVFDAMDEEGRTWAPELAALNETIMDVVPDDTILAGDSSQVTYMGSTTFFRAPVPHSLLYMGTYATLGYGLPAAIGAKLAAPERPVVCLVGDGALMFSIQELMTAVELGLDLPVICVDNGGYGEIRQNMVDRSIQPLGVDLVQPDWVRLAEGFGATGLPATMDTLADTVRTALETKGTSLVHLKI